MTIDKAATEGIIALNAARAAMYKSLASLFYKELGQDEIDHLRGQDLASMGEEGSLMAKGFCLMERFLSREGSGARQKLAVDYASTFLAAGHYEEQMAVPFESVYTSEDGLLMQEARDDVYRLFCEEHIGLADDMREPEDHITFEFWYMVHLIEEGGKALEAGDVEACLRFARMQVEFSATHQINWIGEFCDSVRRCARTDFYRGLADIAQGFVEDEAAVTAEVVDMLEEMARGL